MENQKTPPVVQSLLNRSTATVGAPTQRRSPALLAFVILLFAALIVGTLYLSFQKSAIAKRGQELDQAIATVQTRINDLKTQKIEAAQMTQTWVADIEKTEIRWSRVVKALNDLLPLDPVTRKPKIRFLSYSGSAGGKLQLNAETIPAVDAPFADIAQLVNIFNTNTFFRDAYVPSITRGISETGSVILSFIFQVHYLEQNASSALTSTPTPLSAVTPSVF